jgi:hypothetical protein
MLHVILLGLPLNVFVKVGDVKDLYVELGVERNAPTTSVRDL